MPADWPLSAATATDEHVLVGCRDEQPDWMISYKTKYMHRHAGKGAMKVFSTMMESKNGLH